MANESNEDYSFDYDENAAIDDDDSILSGESGNRDRRLRNIPDTSLYKYLSKRRKCIHFCFRRIRIISFIVTFLYNIFWIITMNKISIDNEHADFNNFKNSIVKYSYIILFKGFVILFLPQVFCGYEKTINDFNYVLNFLKSLTSYIISYFLTSNMKKKLDLDKNFKIMDIKAHLYYWINLYYFFECTYIKLINSILIIILCSILIKILIESYKAIRYIL
jgi:hypothetical protein